MKYTYTALFTEEAGTVYARVPDLKGCITTGKNLQDAINNPDASVGAQCSTFRTVCSIRWLQSALIPFVTTHASGY